jgi:deoxyadenosine/deoxycytidine kinase
MHTNGKISLVVEGNIGAGKSTFLKLLDAYLDIQPVFEPHQKWQNVDGENLLDKFYKDTKRWAYTFQTYAFVSRAVEHDHNLKTSAKPILILERSVFSDRYCFAKNSFEMGVMNHLEWQLYKEWFAWLVYQYTTLPTGFIYLQTNPQICYERMRVRSRSEESTVSLEYLNMLHEKHENWLVKKTGIEQSVKNIPVLVLQCDEDFEHNISEQIKHVQKIVDFFKIQSAVKIKHNELLQKQGEL